MVSWGSKKSPSKRGGEAQISPPPHLVHPEKSSWMARVLQNIQPTSTQDRSWEVSEEGSSKCHLPDQCFLIEDGHGAGQEEKSQVFREKHDLILIPVASAEEGPWLACP